MQTLLPLTSDCSPTPSRALTHWRRASVHNGGARWQAGTQGGGYGDTACMAAGGRDDDDDDSGNRVKF